MALCGALKQYIMFRTLPKSQCSTEMHFLYFWLWRKSVFLPCAEYGCEMCWETRNPTKLNSVPSLLKPEGTSITASPVRLKERCLKTVSLYSWIEILWSLTPATWLGHSCPCWVLHCSAERALQTLLWCDTQRSFSLPRDVALQCKSSYIVQVPPIAINTGSLRLNRKGVNY